MCATEQSHDIETRSRVRAFLNFVVHKTALARYVQTLCRLNIYVPANTRCRSSVYGSVRLVWRTNSMHCHRHAMPHCCRGADHKLVLVRRSFTFDCWAYMHKFKNHSAVFCEARRAESHARNRAFAFAFRAHEIRLRVATVSLELKTKARTRTLNRRSDCVCVCVCVLCHKQLCICMAPFACVHFSEHQLGGRWWVIQKTKYSLGTSHIVFLMLASGTYPVHMLVTFTVAPAAAATRERNVSAPNMRCAMLRMLLTLFVDFRRHSLARNASARPPNTTYAHQ